MAPKPGDDVAYNSIGLGVFDAKIVVVATAMPSCEVLVDVDVFCPGWRTPYRLTKRFWDADPACIVKGFAHPRVST